MLPMGNMEMEIFQWSEVLPYESNFFTHRIIFLPPPEFSRDGEFFTGGANFYPASINFYSDNRNLAPC